MRELWSEIWSSIRRNKLRTFLTGFSVAWGIFMLVVLLGSGNGLKHGIESNFADQATNSMYIGGSRTSKPYMGYQKGRSIDFRNHDMDILRNEFPEVGYVAARLMMWQTSSKNISHGNAFSTLQIRGDMPDIQYIGAEHIVKGRFLNDIDIQNRRKSIVIDQPTANLLFEGEDALGAEVKIDSVMFQIVGIYKDDALASNPVGYIPLTTAQMLYQGGKPNLDFLAITVNGIHTDAQLKDFETRLRTRLAAEHHFDPTDESAIWTDNAMETVKSFQMVFAGINIFVWIIGLATLLAGIVGVSNIMVVTVTERTFEFGIRKALGAKPASIVRLILAESVAITALFGYIGMVLGVAGMELLNYFLTHTPPDPAAGGGMIGSMTMFLNPTVNLGIVVSATLVLIIAGLVAGYVPAHRAAQIKTIDALRHNK